jgi:MFS family permease
MFLIFVTIHLTDAGFSGSQIGILISVIPLSSLALMFPFGMFSDRISPKRVVSISLAITIVFLFGIRYANTFGDFIFWFIVAGVGNSLFRTSLFALYYKTLGERNKGRKLGFFSGIGLYGYGLGPLIGGWLLMTTEWEHMLLIAILVLIPFFIMSFFLEEVKPFKFYVMEYGRDMLRKEVIILAILGFVLALHLGAEQTSLSLFMEKICFLDDKTIGSAFGFIGLAIGTLTIANGFLSDRISGAGKGLARLLYMGLFFSGLFNVAMLFPATFASVLGVRLCHVFGDSMFVVSQRVIVSNLFLSERIGGNWGLISTIFTVGIFAGALISGALPGYTWPFVVAGACAIFAIIPAMAMKPKF